MIKSNAQNHQRVQALMTALDTLSPGQTITYEQLTVAVGEEITGGSYLLQQALRQQEKATGAIFSNVHGIGYQRLATKDIPGVGKRANTRIRKVARRTRVRLENVRANDISPADTVKIAAYRSHFGMIESFANERSVKAVEANMMAAEPVTPAMAAVGLADLMKS